MPYRLKIFLFIITIAFLAPTTYAQDKIPRMDYRNGVGLYFIGPNAVGSVSYDYFVTPHLNAEAGIGFIGVHLGLKTHFWGGRADKKWTPYLGASITRSLFPSVGTDYLPYFPAGINYVGENGFNFAFEIAPLQLNFLAWNVAGLKFGYRF